MLNQIFVFLVQTIAVLASTLLLIRFLLQISRADFYNPLSQAIVRLTNPICKPLRTLLPKLGSVDLASLLLALLVQLAAGALLFGLFAPESLGVVNLLVMSIANLLRLITQFYFFALMLVFVLSWVAPGSRHPGAVLIYQLTEPLLGPVRRIIPPVAGLDFSVMVVLMIIYILQNIVFRELPGF